MWIKPPPKKNLNSYTGDKFRIIDLNPGLSADDQQEAARQLKKNKPAIGNLFHWKEYELARKGSDFYFRGEKTSIPVSSIRWQFVQRWREE